MYSTKRLGFQRQSFCRFAVPVSGLEGLVKRAFTPPTRGGGRVEVPGASLARPPRVDLRAFLAEALLQDVEFPSGEAGRLIDKLRPGLLSPDPPDEEEGRSLGIQRSCKGSNNGEGRAAAVV